MDMMTKKDFKELAVMIDNVCGELSSREYRDSSAGQEGRVIWLKLPLDSIRHILTEQIIFFCKRQNPNFDEERFRKDVKGGQYVKL